MRFRTKLIAWAIVLLTVTAIGFSTIPPAKGNAKFVIAYDFDESNNGHYIAYIGAIVDGEHNATVYYNPVSYPDSTAIQPLEIQQGVNLTLSVFCWVNGTSADIASLSEGLNIMQHNVSVVLNNGTTIFSQQNFTYIIGTDGDAPMYFYRHDVILVFTPAFGEIYTVTVNYEVYY